MASDPMMCRRALREIAEIAAVAVLQDSQMTEQEALQTIAAIAEWAEEEAPGARADCGAVIRSVNALTSRADLDSLTDREALELFDQVLAALRITDLRDTDSADPVKRDANIHPEVGSLAPEDAGKGPISVTKAGEAGVGSDARSSAAAAPS